MSSCPKVSLSASATKMAVATRVCRQGSQPQETAPSCFDKQATGWCQEPSSWVKTPTAVPSLSCTYRKKAFITSGKHKAGAFVSALLISLKAFSYSSPIPWFPVLPSLWLHKVVLPRESNWGVQIQQKPAAPRNSLICCVLGAGIEQTTCFLSGNVVFVTVET
jgi:hypothetical protein